MPLWGWSHFLLQALLIFSFNFWVARRLKLPFPALIYLSLLPFLLWFQGNLSVLLLGLSLGYLSYFERGAKRSWLPAGVLLLLILGELKGGLRLEYPVQLINQLRGEHEPATGFLPRLLHNKLELGYFWLKTVESRLSLTRLYAAGNFRLLSPYFLMGLVYPWDFWFHLKALKRWAKQARVSWARGVWLGLVLFWLGLTPNSRAAQIGLISFVYWLSLNGAAMIGNWSRVWLVAGLYTLIQLYLALNFIIPL